MSQTLETRPATVLREADVDSIRTRVARGRVDDISSLSFGGATLGAVLELACAWVQWRAEGRFEAEALVEAWARRIPEIRDAYVALTAPKPQASVVADFGAPTSEFLAIREPEDFAGDGGLMFQDRFARALRENGFSREMALGLVAAFAEMADNIVQHSGKTRSSPAPGLVGFQVRRRWMCFAVADTGRGVLASLRTNERYRWMERDHDALTHAVQHAATSRDSALTGNGFAEVHRALADLAGKLRFRSGTACLLLDGQGGTRDSTVKRCEFLLGFQLSVTCALDGSAPPVAFAH